MDFIFEAVRWMWGYRELLAGAAIAAFAIVAFVETSRWVRRRKGGTS